VTRQVVEDVLGRKDAKELWTTRYVPLLPLLPQDFSMGAVLPVVLYMMRWGHRRGKGAFQERFQKGASIEQIARQLAEAPDSPFEGFDDPAKRAILGDLLLAWCLENRRRDPGRDAPVQRVFPTHYLSSWIDLPADVANLRFVPEMVVAILARQQEGDVVEAEKTRGRFAIGGDFASNLLLEIFGKGVSIEGQRDSLRSDRFAEEAQVGLDQLLTIRLAQALGEAPKKAKGENPNILNQLPVSTLAVDRFHEDLSVFLRAYGRTIPRQALLPLIDTCFSVGVSTIFLSAFDAALRWADTGTVPPRAEQRVWPLFVDASLGMDHEIRRISEENFDDLLRRIARFPVISMCLRILDQRARQNKVALPDAAPDPAARLNALGDLLFGRSDDSRDIMRDLARDCQRLAESLEESGQTRAAEVLMAEGPHPAWRLAEALVLLMGDKKQSSEFRSFLESSLMINEPNGLAQKRRAILKSKSTERRSAVLTNTAMDFLVHRLLRKAAHNTTAAPLSLPRFLDKLRERYGLYIDEAPDGLSVPVEILSRNRLLLERRLRDLDLLVGVNDAESLKRLQQRFDAHE
jgi:hypothetical protein